LWSLLADIGEPLARQWHLSHSFKPRFLFVAAADDTTTSMMLVHCLLCPKNIGLKVSLEDSWSSVTSQRVKRTICVLACSTRHPLPVPHHIRTSMSDLKLNPRVKPSPYTGSAFDVTLTGTIKERPGGHFSGPSLPIDVSAFSHSKKTMKVDPHEYVKKGTGLGGTIVVSISLSSLTILILHPAIDDSDLISTALWKPKA
jgi:hypothetical protein